jgi:hypothetical protein
MSIQNNFVIFHNAFRNVRHKRAPTVAQSEMTESKCITLALGFLLFLEWIYEKCYVYSKVVNNTATGKNKDTFFFAVLGFWTQGLHLEALHQPFFVKGFFKIESQELLA